MNLAECLQMTANLLAPAFFDMLGLAALGAVLIAIAGQIAAKTKQRVFYDKYGQQTAAMGFMLLVVTLAAVGASAAMAASRFPWLMQWLTHPQSPFIKLYIAAGAFIVLSLPYALAWKKMRNAKGAHMALGLGAAISGAASILLAMAALLVLALTTSRDTTPLTMAQLPLDGTSLLWPMASQYILLGTALAAGLSCAYLVLRRNKDDFGRDYYRFSLKLAARWAIIPMIGQIACQGWLFALLPETTRTLILSTPLGAAWAAAAILPLICIILWAVIAKSQAPLRLKGMTFVAAVLLWLAHACDANVFVNLMSML